MAARPLRIVSSFGFVTQSAGRAGSTDAGCEVDIWRTTYYHQMPSHQAIIDWVTATGLRPWLQDLTESEQQHFLTRYHQMLEEQYPLQENGQILLAFPRLFIVARRTE